MGYPYYFLPTMAQLIGPEMFRIGYCRFCGALANDIEPGADREECIECLSYEVYSATEYLQRGWVTR